jgi:hypothetical protein
MKKTALLVSSIAAICGAQNMYPGNQPMWNLALKSKYYSDQQYSYAGTIQYNIPIGNSFSVRPSLGGNFYNNNLGNYDVDEFTYGLEFSAVTLSPSPFGISLLLTRELLYTQESFSKVFFNERLYRELYGHLKVEIDKTFRAGRSIKLIPAISSWFLFNSSELNGVFGIALTTLVKNEVFLSIRYDDIEAKSRDDSQFRLGASLGVILGKEEEP